jgi:peptide/nickel transport system substrate-binding protein
MNKLRELSLAGLMFFGLILLFLPLVTILPEFQYLSKAKVTSYSQSTPIAVVDKNQNRQTKGTFIEGSYGGDAETLNFLLAADGTSFSYIGHTIDALATYNNKLELVPMCMAKDVEVSPDALTYTVTIRDDLKWSNGSSVTAEDYVYTLKNLMFSDWLNYPYKEDWMEKVNGKMVFVEPAVVNPTTFTINRKTVDPEFNYIIYDMVPYPKYISTKYEGNIDAFTKAPEFNTLSYTGNLGPYKYKDWIRNDKYVVERNPDYYKGKAVGAPFFDQYVIKQFGNSTTMLAALEAGDITEAGIEASKVSRFKSLKNIDVYTIPSGGYTLITYNLRKNSWEGMKNKSVRQALSMSIGKEKIVDKIYYGFGEPAFSFLPNTSPWYNKDAVTKFGVGSLYDKQKALDLLVKAGYEKKTEEGKTKLVGKDGKQVKLTLVTTTGGGTGENICFLVKQELADIGIDVDLKLVPWENVLRKYLMNKVPGSNQELRDNNGPDAVSEESWDMILMAFGTDVKAPSGSGGFFTKDGGLNFMGYYNTQIDTLFERVKSREAIDTKVRAQLYAEISKILSEDQPVDFLVFPLGNAGFQKNVKGVEPGISMTYNYYLWYFE